MTPLSTARDRAVRVGVPMAVAFGSAAGLGALVLSHGPARFTSYAGRSGFFGVLVLTVGLALLAAGWLTSREAAFARSAVLAATAGVLWAAPAFEGWVEGPSWVRSVASLTTPFLVPVLLHLVLAYPNGRARTRTERGIVLALYAGAVVVSVGRALFRDPFFDPACWANCTDNVFLVRSVPGLARALASGERWLHAAGSVVVLVVLSLRLIHRTPGPGSIVPVLPSALALTIVSTGRLASLWRHPPKDPLESALFAWFVLACLGVIALAGALAWAVARARRERRAIARTVASLGEVPAPGSLGMALAAAVGDPDLRIAYVLEDPVRLVDGNGRPVEPPSTGEGRSVTTLVREGKPVALVSHLARATDLEREIGPAVRLGLENERLQADVLARLDELRASRTRIVEKGDAERRRLERDLHDGAQQRVLALSFDIRVAIGAAEAAGDEPAETALRAALDRTELALGDLRELAHGIYPAVLSESGLVAAIGDLGDVAPIPVSIAADPVSDRFAPPVERAAYLVVAEAIADAARGGAEAVSVRLDREASSLVVLVEDDGHGDRRRFAAVADRVGATGGRLTFEPGAIRAEIPCA